MTELGVSLPLHLDHLFLHLLSIIPVEGVALDDRGYHAFTSEDLLERVRTVLVPAPEDPVITMMGCLTDKKLRPLSENVWWPAALYFVSAPMAVTRAAEDKLVCFVLEANL
jgi:hypothetical protein